MTCVGRLFLASFRRSRDFLYSIACGMLCGILTVGSRLEFSTLHHMKLLVAAKLCVVEITHSFLIA